MLFDGGDTDTICALSTPPGVGGIAVIRVSGPGAGAMTRQVCPFLPEVPQSHRVYFGRAKEVSTGQELDELLVTFFGAGRSFTGEETTELSCHGSPIVVGSLLKELVKVGCRQARKGEFTFRAFMNGRIDLVQAEGVLSLIESQSQQAAKVALRQLKGRLSEDVGFLEDRLTWVLAQLEAGIDFSTEGIEVVDSAALKSRVLEVIGTCERLIRSYEQGRILSEGLVAVLVGRPNVGKSSLLNAILGEDRAIVTALPGTTRDLVDGRFSINGSPITLIDTAGLRETDDEIEQIGIQRTREALEKADLVFHVVEAGRRLLFEEIEELRAVSVASDWSRHRLLINKVDLSTMAVAEIQDQLRESGVEVPVHAIYPISAKQRKGVEKLESALAEFLASDVSETSSIITQVRHLELIEKIRTCANRALALITSEESAEFIAFELQDAIRAIHELLGKEFHEQVIDRIFKEFCLGK